MNMLVSACLLGMECRYNGKGVLGSEIEELLHTYHLIPVCPKVMGGLITPRTPAERIQGRVVTRDGEDAAVAYQKGAETALKLAQLYGCRAAILREQGPSCSRKRIYDGASTAGLIPGDEVCAGFLEQHGIKVYRESRITRLLEELERY